MSADARTVRILGTHGVPAAYGGFETAAENIGLHLLSRGWKVLVYCQVADGESVAVDEWRGLTRVKIAETREGWRGTSSFDFKSIRHALRHYQPGETWLTFGYNTGVFDIAPRLRGVPNVINMDGMEWTRTRWGPAKQAILLANERCAGLVGDVLVADHPEIARYLRRHFGARRVSTITYGAHEVTAADPEPALALGVTPGHYGMVVCRPIPENNVVEIVSAWSQRHRGVPLLVVGPYAHADPYQARVMAAASDEVIFPGPIFEPSRINALRFHAAVYLHGHTVGGTNPSLVEAMSAGNAVIAHDNVYNRWVAGPDNAFFTGVDDLSALIDDVLGDPRRRGRMGEASRDRFRAEFTWARIGDQYAEALLAAREARNKGPRRATQKVGEPLSD